ncbi:LamG-like jellyroll fold domain-containing protein [Nonomuraea sp. NPDC050790]|uniref:LamG-like jellyroll fold domain-containing protein n=1 Tax=Nonomuraea sp. NPDC050790 TaxID=3364371 RepID=UPI0037A6F881
MARYSDDVVVWSGSVADVASGTQASIVVPAAKLVDGVKYEWRVKATTPGSTPAWTIYQYFTADVPEAVVDQFQVSPSMTVGGETVTSTRTPELRARITDPLGGASTVDVQVADWATDTVRWSTAVAAVSSGGQAVVTVPPGILADQVKYEFRVKATTPGSSPGWTSWQVFRVDLPDPATDPSVIDSQVVPSQVVSEVTETSTLTPELRASIGHPQGSASRVEFEIEHDPGAPAGQGTGRIWSVAVDNVASGSVATAGVPAGTLVNGWRVRWRVQAVAGTTTSGWSAWQVLKVNRPDSAPQVREPQVVPSSAVGGRTVTSTLTPELRTTVTDPRGEPLTAEFEVEHDPAAPEGQGSGLLWSRSVTGVAVGAQAAVAVPAGTLADGWHVRWRVRATSPSADSAWSDWQALLVDVPKPGVTGLQVTPSTAVGGAVVTDVVTPSLHATVTYAPGGTMKAEFELEHDPDAGQGSGPIWSGAVEGLAAGSAASVSVPAGKLDDGSAVRWRVRSQVAGLTSAWSGWQKLRVDRPDSQPSISELQVTPAAEVAGKLVTSTLTPTLRATVADPRGDALTAEFEVWHDPDAGQGDGQIWTGSVTGLDAGAQAALAVPAGKLADEQAVRWRARAVSANAASAWSPWKKVTVDLPKPSVGSLAIAPLMSGTGQVTTRSLTPTLSAKATHPEGAASTVEFVVEHDPGASSGQGSGPIWTGSAADSPSGAEARVSVPANTLVEGWQIRWRVRATSGGLSSKWSDWQQAVAGLIEPGEEPLARTEGPVVRTDQSFTVAAWLRWSDKDGAYSVVEQKGEHQAPFRLGNDREHGLVFTFTGSDAADAAVEGVRSGVEAPADEWFHLAGVYDAATRTATIHLNGTAVGTATLTFPAWNASRPMTVGTSMVGSIDDVRVHLKNLTSAEIGALRAPQSTPAPLASPSAKASTQVANDFSYGHMSLEDCERGRDQRVGDADQWNGGEGWDSISPYNGCWSRHLNFAIYERSTKYSKHCRCMVTTTSVQDYLNFDMTVVMHSYLGSEDGLSVIGGAGTSLSPRDIKVWTRVDNFWTVDDDFWAMLLGVGGTDPDDLYQSFKLQVDVARGTNDCVKVFSSGDDGGLTRTGPVRKWMDDGDDVFIFHSAFGTGRASRCSIRPWMVYNDPVHAGDWDKIAVSAWGKPENDKSAGAPTVRCDSLSMGAKTATYKGGCVFYGSNRVYEMSRLDLDNGAVARHIEMAYTRPQDTVPFKTDGPKHFPGKWPSGEALSRITSKDPRYRANQDAKDEVCDEFFDDRPRKLNGEKDKTKWEQCDEFPFASTKQGAAFVHDRYGAKNFSVKSILGSQNTSAGRHLNIFYARYRVLANDKFWVHLK